MVQRKSRLTRLEEKRALKTTAMYVVLTLVLIIFLVIFGIPLLSKVSSLVSGVNSGGDVEDTNSPPPPPPQINSLPTHTKEDKLTLKGTSRPGITVNIFFNDDKIEILSDAGGEFTSVLELSSGENTIYAQAVDNSGKTSVNSRKFSVVLDKEKPDLEIISPENDKKIFGSQNRQIEIQGQTEVDAKVTINDRIAIVRSDGKFDFGVNLNEGENIFKIKSTDLAGNEVETELKISFFP